MVNDQSKASSNRVKLTDAFAKGVVLPESGVVIHWDTECRNFGLRLKKTGSSWIVRVKVNQQAYERTIAELYTGMTAATARKIAQERVVELRNGIDRDKVLKERIEQERQDRLAAMSLKEAVTKYLEENKTLGERTRDDYQKLIDNELAPYASVPLREVSREIAEKMVGEIAAEIMRPRTKEDKAVGKRSVSRNGSRANYAMRLVRALCFAFEQGCQNWGKRRGKAFPWIRTKAKRTELDPDAGHGAMIWKALSTRRCDTSADYIKAIMLTGARRTEMAEVKVKDINIRNRTMILVDTKNHEDHVIYMPDQLFEIVERRMKDRKTGEAKAPDATVFENCSEPKKLLASVSEEVGVKFTCHSLRKFFAITCLTLEIPTPVYKRCLNHSMENSDDVTEKHYAHATPTQLRKAWQKVADFNAPRDGVVSLNAHREAA